MVDDGGCGFCHGPLFHGEVMCRPCQIAQQEFSFRVWSWGNYPMRVRFTEPIRIAPRKAA